jgi:hypothetical protein
MIHREGLHHGQWNPLLVMSKEGILGAQVA